MNINKKLLGLFSNNSIKFTLFLFIALIISYYPQLSGDFLGDDYNRIYELGETFSLKKILLSAIGDRPILCLSIWIDRTILGLSAGLMRLENIIFLILIGLSMRKIVAQIKSIQDISTPSWWSDAVIFLFCIHPIHTQTIGHVVQRGVLLSVLFSLVSTAFLLKSQFQIKNKNWKFALLAWTISILSKPNMIFMPIAWFLLARSMRMRTDWKSFVPFVLMAILPYAFYKFGGYSPQILEDLYTARDYFLGESYIIFKYFQLIILPLGLRFNHDIVFASPEPLIPGLLLWIAHVVIVVLAVKYIKPKIAGLIFAIGYLAFLPESSVFPIMHTIFEHRIFAPMMFFAISLSLVNPQFPKKVCSLLFALLVLISILLNYQRTQEVRTFAGWAKQEIGHSCNVSSLALILTNILIIEKKPEVALEGLKNLSWCKNQNDDHKIALMLAELFVHKNDRERTAHILSSLRPYVHSDSKTLIRRREIINSNVATFYIDHYPEDESYCEIEKFFAQQLRYFKSNRDDFSHSISFYAMNAQQCLNRLAGKNSPAAIFQRNKIRTIKFHHFGIRDESLAHDLSLMPDNEETRYLIQMYNLTAEKMQK